MAKLIISIEKYYQEPNTTLIYEIYSCKNSDYFLHVSNDLGQKDVMTIKYIENLEQLILYSCTHIRNIHVSIELKNKFVLFKERLSIIDYKECIHVLLDMFDTINIEQKNNVSLVKPKIPFNITKDLLSHLNL